MVRFVHLLPGRSSPSYDPYIIDENSREIARKLEVPSLFVCMSSIPQRKLLFNTEIRSYTQIIMFSFSDFICFILIAFDSNLLIVNSTFCIAGEEKMETGGWSEFKKQQELGKKNLKATDSKNKQKLIA